MIISYYEQVDVDALPSDATAETHLFLINIDDISAHASSLIDTLTDTSWISKLNAIPRASYEKIALKTAKRLVEIFQNGNGTVQSDFGEYMISMSAGRCLEDKLNHIVLPISELWKEKLTGNPGFDFHTVTHRGRVSFGEAKYSSNHSPYTDAAEQASRFIQEGKDQMDAVHLMHLASDESVKALLKGSRGLAIAFSLHSADHNRSLQKALQSDLVQQLSRLCDELYIIGVYV